MEAHFCREMSNHVISKIRELRFAVEALQDKGELSTAESSHSSQKLINSLIQNIEKLENLDKRQQVFLLLLNELKKALNETKVILKDYDCNLWTWLETSKTLQEWQDLVFEDYPNYTCAQYVSQCCTKLENFLAESSSQTQFKQKMQAYLFDRTLGSLDAMRIELQSRFNAQHEWIQTPDNKKIDVLLIPGNSSDQSLSNSPESKNPQQINVNRPTMVLCNPNATYFEYLYYQNEWLDYYVNASINVVVWNYRGYGRSQGKPNIKKIKQDGELIIQWLRHNKKCTIIGVHGESLGGSVASHLANKCRLDFLFADRCFQRLDLVAKKNFNVVAQVLFIIALGKQYSVVQDFLDAQCYKIVSADPFDNIINDSSSLKVGIAQNYLKDQQIMNQSECENFLENFNQVMKIIVMHKKSQAQNRSPSALTKVKYTLLDQSQSIVEDDHINIVLLSIFCLIENLDAAGQQLTSLYGQKKQLQQFQTWIICFFIWGSYLPLDPTANYDPEIAKARALNKINQAKRELRMLISNNEFLTNKTIVEIMPKLVVIENGLQKIKQAMEKTNLSTSTSQISSTERGLKSSRELKIQVQDQESQISELAKQMGFLLPLSCGHNGTFSNTEKHLYEGHLQRSGFI